jgi:tetratricopeptide (TPR) repeat protein
VTVALVRIEAALGDVFMAQKSFVSAGEAYREALAVAETLSDGSPNRSAHDVLRAGIYRPLGDLHRAQGDFAAALRSYEQALAIDLANTARFPAEPEYRRLLALTHLRVAAIRAAEGLADEARDGYREATAILNQLAGAGHVSAGLRREVAVGRARLGVMLDADGDAAGRDEVRAAAAAFRQLVSDDPADARSRRDLLVTLVQLGDVLRRDDRAAARDAYREAREVALILLAGDDADGPAGRDLAVVNRRLERLAAGGDAADLKLFKIVDGRRVLFQTGDPPPRVRTSFAAAATAPGRTQYLVTFGSEGPPEILEQAQLSRANWVIPAAGPPPSQTILLLATSQPLSDAEKRRLRDEIAAVEGPRTVDAESQIVWDVVDETLESTTTARGIEGASWVHDVRARIERLGRIAIAGRTFPLAPGP